MTHGDHPLIAVHVDVWAFWHRDPEREMRFADRVIARRSVRDSAVQLGGGVQLMAGGFKPSGGSMLHPKLAALPGTVLQVDGVDPEHDDVTFGPGVTVLDTTTLSSLGLLAERARLMARVAEIDRTLRDLGGPV